MLNRCYVIILLLITVRTWGQSNNSYKGLPKGYPSIQGNYLFPIRPGHRSYLTGNMGELRSNHLHSGIDIRTNTQIGIPILAAQDGYVSRISISPVGYGNTLYLTHPDGQITVYAHLHRFEDKLANYVTEEQYKIKSFRINIFPQKEEWRVNRGDIIAYSGNSGSSGGPHLHFDIRNSNNEALNPLKLQFEEIVDNLPPVALKIALQTMDVKARVNNRFGRFEFPLLKKDGRYILSDPIFAKGRIGIEISTYDELNNSSFRCGVNYIEVQVENQKIFSQAIEKINFSKTRSVLALINYGILYSKEEFFNKLYISDGNNLDYYEGTTERGILVIGDNKKTIKIILTDTYDNESQVLFSIQPSPILQKVPILPTLGTSFFSTESENTLVIQSKNKIHDIGNSAQIFYGGNSLWLSPTYLDSYQNVFLIDMRKILPDSIVIGKEVIKFNFRDMIPSGIAYQYEGRHVNIEFKKNALYDTIFLRTKYDFNDRETFSIGPSFYPLKKNIKITLKPANQYAETASVYQIVDKTYEYKGGTWKNGHISFLSRGFGDYIIMLDTIPPTIIKTAMDSKNISFQIRDDHAGIDTYEAHIEDYWLLMNYDPKTGTLKANPLDRLKPLKGQLRLEVIDRAGNKNIYSNTIP